MIFLNPNDFEGCKSDVRVVINSNMLYTSDCYNYPQGPTDHIIIFEDLTGCAKWKFNSKRDRDQAIEKIDRICKNKHNQVDDLLYTIETQ